MDPVAVPEDKLEDMNPDSEEAYDEKIAPLMDQVIALCKEHRIPMMANFQLTAEREGIGTLQCTTRLPFRGESPSFNEAWPLFYSGRPAVLAAIIVSPPEEKGSN